MAILKLARERGGIDAAQQKIDASLALWEIPTMIMILDAKRRLTVPATLAPTAPGDAFLAW